MTQANSNPVLDSLQPVIQTSSYVRTDIDAIAGVARWMAREPFVFPTGSLAGPEALTLPPDEQIDLTMLITSLNFAFTDFESGQKFEVESDGRIWSDTEAMVVRILQALQAGVPLLDGDYLAAVSPNQLADIFRGNIELPLLAQRATILNEIGAVLGESYQGRFHHFVRSCPQAIYAEGDGLLERLIVDFSRFNDVSTIDGHTVQFHKLGQLGLWAMHVALSPTGHFCLHDLDQMTAFADYIVPVALNVMGIIEYDDSLAERIRRGTLIDRDSRQEIEIRAHTLNATALLTAAINQIRPEPVVIPQVDYRLWSTYHATFEPHHLTPTIMY